MREVAPGTTVATLIADVTATSPRLTALRPSTMFMVNQEYAPLGQQLADGDEVAVIPPVSGGSQEADSSTGRLFKVVETPLDVNEVIRAVEDPAAGATVSFIGTVRDNSLGKGSSRSITRPIPPPPRK